MSTRRRSKRPLVKAGLLAVVIGTVAVAVTRLVIVLALALWAWVAEAQTQRSHPVSDPAAIALHERHVRATGGATPPAFQHSVVEMRIGTGPVMRTEMWIAQPDLIRVTTLVGGQPMMDFGYDGTTGWSTSPATGLIRLGKEALAELRATAAGVATPALDSTTRSVAIGRSTFDDQPVDGVRAITAAGDTAEIYYAVSTGLLAGMRLRSGANPAANMVVTMRDYKRIAGRMQHTLIIIRGPAIELEQRTIAMDHEPIEPGRFKAPAQTLEVPPHNPRQYRRLVPSSPQGTARCTRGHHQVLGTDSLRWAQPRAIRREAAVI
jgi:hypothetical protein